MKRNTNYNINLKTLLTAVFSYFFAFAAANAQTPLETYKMANKAFAYGDTQTAVNLIERSIYFTKNLNLKAEELFRLSKVFFLRQDIEKSLKYSGLAYNYANDSLQNEIIFFRTFLFLLDKDVLSAKEEILQANTGISVETDKRIHLYYAGVLYYSRDFEASYKEFCNIVDDTIFLKEKLEKAQKISRRSSYWYFFASSLIPGSGQMLTGHIKQGLTSLVLLGGLAGLFIEITKNYTWLEGFAAVFPWYERYFMGGVNDAYDYAEIMKQKKLARIFSEITERIK